MDRGETMQTFFWRKEGGRLFTAIKYFSNLSPTPPYPTPPNPAQMPPHLRGSLSGFASVQNAIRVIVVYAT